MEIRENTGKRQDNKRRKFISFYYSVIARFYNGKKEKDLIVMDPKKDLYHK